ncbi:hypothetical protein [Acinetobacter terrae]|uniref:Uracil-DNA glycosylase-like domain-containing protein n=1 Tax=Acinetobacter terrae TaxID=2731247 RepID=A0A8E4H4C9_9GAMM|nr:hypothetical protein [Acinetobacter terrae]NNH37608.1 hypothetical protein [Acinetobacter terrae]
MNTSLNNFYLELKKLVDGELIRPFVCNGNPLKTDILIIGFNPATETDNFWDYFDDKVGFHKELWLETYKNKRKKSKKTELSNTRRVIEWINKDLEEFESNLIITETNIYSFPTRKKSDLNKNDRNTEIFDYLMFNLNPKVIITHGVDVERYIKVMNLNIPIFYEKHFAIGWSREKAKTLAHQIIKLVK